MLEVTYHTGRCVVKDDAGWRGWEEAQGRRAKQRDRSSRWREIQWGGRYARRERRDGGLVMKRGRRR